MKFPKNPVIGELFKARTDSKYAYQWDGETWDIVTTASEAKLIVEPDGTSAGIVKKIMSEVYNEEPVGEINGENTIFRLASSPIEGSEKIYVNGLIQRAGADYQIIDRFIYLENALENGERIMCSYSELKILEVSNEIPQGLIDGKNKTFTLRKIPIDSSECIYLNGILLTKGREYDYIINNNIFILNDAPFPGERIICSYQTFL